MKLMNGKTIYFLRNAYKVLKPAEVKEIIQQTEN